MSAKKNSSKASGPKPAAAMKNAPATSTEPTPKATSAEVATKANDTARSAALVKLTKAPKAVLPPVEFKAPAKPDKAKAAKEPAADKPKPTKRGKARVSADASTPRTGGLTAAHQVLSAAKEPMNVRAITKAAMDKGLWKPGGKTPSATLAAAIGREIKEKGKQSRFKKSNRGLFIAVTPR